MLKLSILLLVPLTISCGSKHDDINDENIHQERNRSLSLVNCAWTYQCVSENDKNLVANICEDESGFYNIEAKKVTYKKAFTHFQGLFMCIGLTENTNGETLSYSINETTYGYGEELDPNLQNKPIFIINSKTGKGELILRTRLISDELPTHYTCIAKSKEKIN